MIFLHLSKCILISTLVKFNIYNDKLLKILVRNIYKCGVIPVKMVQWGLPYMKLINIDNKIIDVLENTYEKCPVHDVNFTKETYKNDFYTDLDNDYNIIDIVGSGSIAQVYKIKSKKTNKIYAMKVKHPNARRDFELIKMYLKIIFALFSFNRIIPISLNDFLNQFEDQLNFINESNNLIRFGKLYKNNNLYKIPKLYKLSENIIIMDYITGRSLDTIKDSNLEHYKYNMCIYIFIQNNLFMNDFNHGDLHNYNWKITDENKIVIYDFGLCWELTNNNDIVETINILNNGFYYKDNCLIYKAFYNYIRYSSNIDETYIKKYFNAIPKQIDRFIDFSYNIINFCLEYNITLNIKLLYKIISYQNNLFVFMKNFCSDEDFDYNGVYKEEYNICDYHNILPEYKLFLKNQINKYPKKVDYNEFNKFIT